jgi:hypothetical protein
MVLLRHPYAGGREVGLVSYTYPTEGIASRECLRSPFRPGQSGNPGGARAFPHKTWPLARDILHKTILANQAAFEQALTEVMRTKRGALQVLELLAKLNREIGARGRGPGGQDRDRREHPAGGHEGRRPAGTAPVHGHGRNRQPVRVTAGSWVGWTRPVSRIGVKTRRTRRSGACNHPARVTAQELGVNSSGIFASLFTVAS